MRIESPVPIESGRGIVLNAERVSVAGAATVKHVARYADRYIIGLELAQVAGSKALAALRQPWELRGPASLV